MNGTKNKILFNVECNSKTERQYIRGLMKTGKLVSGGLKNSHILIRALLLYKQTYKA